MIRIKNILNFYKNKKHFKIFFKKNIIYRKIKVEENYIKNKY